MRILSALFLLTIFTLASQGWQVSRHFCGGVEVSTELALISPDASCCGDDGAATDCCSNEITAIGLDDNFFQTTLSDLVTPACLQMLPVFCDKLFALHNKLTTAFIRVDHPPPGGVPLRLLVSCFRL